MEDRIEAFLMSSPFKHIITPALTELKENYGLKKVDAEVLYFLSVCNGHDTPTDIYNRLLLNKGHISQAIETLLERGLISAEIDEYDKRSTHYNVTPEASESIHRIEEMLQSMKAQLLKGISEEEYTAFRQVLNKMYQNISR